MWCDKCQADVAIAPASSSGERTFCETCGEELSRPHTAASFGEIDMQAKHDPRELLARWAREDALGSLDAETLPVVPRPSQTRAGLRFDAAHSVNRSPGPHIETIPEQSSPATPLRAAPVADESNSSVHRVHRGHGVNAPHIPVAPLPVTTFEPGAKWVTLVGQLFAYFGVGGLTVGTVLALLGYFGGPASYATTGWLVATAGQMLLFLGVVTLVSGGMEQTTHEVARRIDTLGERLERIEEVALGGRAAPGSTESDVR